MLFWMKQILAEFPLQRDETGNRFSNIKDTFAERFQLQTLIVHQWMCIFKAYLSSLSDDWSNKEKVPDVSDSNQNVETACNSKLKFTELIEICSSKGCRKSSERWIMYAANTKIGESTDEYFYYWNGRVFFKVLQGKWCQDPQKPCSITLRLLCSQIICMLQIDSFIWSLDSRSPRTLIKRTSTDMEVSNNTKT